MDIFGAFRQATINVLLAVYGEHLIQFGGDHNFTCLPNMTCKSAKCVRPSSHALCLGRCAVPT